LNEAFNTPDVEILLSTMNRDSLDFLVPMFQFAHFSDFNILIINQTTQDKQLTSPYPTVRVINMFDKGLSKSRNLAIANAQGKIALIADDDLVFLEGFDQKIVKGFNHFPDAAAIKFITITFDGKPCRKYPQVPVEKLTDLQRLNSTSWEIALNIEKVRRSGKQFHLLFGLGSVFPLGEEPIFLNELYHAGWQVSHYPETIVSHPVENNSGNISLSENYRIRGAYISEIFKWKFALWLGIQLAYNLKSGKVKPWQSFACIRDAFRGKRQLKKIYENNA
jgi:glycosyltransferase involved in cell wall biosynthesis